MGARLLWDKGVGEYVEAARALTREGWKARFWLAGAPDKGNSACVADGQLERWRREGPVEFLGHRGDMPDLMRQASIAVLPSYHEGIPLFLVEAAASGLPIVATEIEGCRAVVERGANGLLVPPRDAAALAAALRQLLASPELRGRMGAEGRRLAVERFDDANVVREYLQVYRDYGSRR
jgi:glycosyltransferase involved in cell wall biosynthesis